MARVEVCHLVWVCVYCVSRVDDQKDCTVHHRGFQAAGDETQDS